MKRWGQNIPAPIFFGVMLVANRFKQLRNAPPIPVGPGGGGR